MADTIDFKKKNVNGGSSTTSLEKSIDRPGGGILVDTSWGKPKSPADDPRRTATASEKGADTAGHDEVFKSTTNLREVLLATKRQKAIDRYIEAAEARHAAAAAAAEPLPSFFPLEYFDDLTFEIPDIDAVRAALRAGEPVPALSLWHLGDGSSEWRACVALEAKEGEDAFLIRWACNGQSKWAARLNVCFDGRETPGRVAARRAQALDHRARCEAVLRYERRLDARPSAGAQQLSPQQFHAVAQRVGGPPAWQRRLAEHRALVEEVLGHYARSMVKIALDHTRAEPDPAETADGVAARGERGLPVRALRVPGHGAFSLVPLDRPAEPDRAPGGGDGGEAGAGAPAAGEAAAGGVRAGVGAVLGALSWAAPSMMRALQTIRKCTLAAHEKR
jgi:hypothetical protein